MGSFQYSKRSDNKQYTVKVDIFIENLNGFFLFLRAVVNIPIQTFMTSPWLLFHKIIFTQNRGYYVS